MHPPPSPSDLQLRASAQVVRVLIPQQAGQQQPWGLFHQPYTRAEEPGGSGVTPHLWFQEPTSAGAESSTNDISHYIGMLDPWYERNVLGLMNLPMDVLCQV